MNHTGKLDEVVWNRYFGHWDQLGYDAELLLAKFKEKKLEESLEESISIDISTLPKGFDRKQEIKRRINQDFFRKTVLSSYNYKCCITGINNPKLLQSSHIIGWSENEENRTNPQNGLCLNIFFHKAYDENLIGISPDYEVFVSEKIFGNKPNYVDETTINYLQQYDKKKITLPQRFLPNKDFLATHFEKYIKEYA